jgi:hypothetical protein
MGFPNDSTGMVSRRLKSFGSCLSNTLNVDKPCLIFYLSDEIFALGCPILVTIDAVSTAILRIELASDRTGSTWKQHFSELKDHQFIAKGLGSDRGAGIINGFQDLYPDVTWCSDHFHEFTDLTKLRGTLEKQAWQHDHQSHQHKGKQKKYHLAERDFWLEVATPLLGKQAQQQIAQAFELFNGMVRTSSLIEMVNSQIRPHLNMCKGQITQEHLNLMMFITIIIATRVENVKAKPRLIC